MKDIIPGYLTKFATTSKDEKVFKSFTIRTEEETDTPALLQNFKKVTGINNVAELFSSPVRFSSIAIPDLREVFQLTFGDLESPLECVLRTIKARRSFRKGSEVFTYDLLFTKEVEPELDSVLETFLNQKSVNPVSGKKVFNIYSIELVRTGTESAYVDEDADDVKPAELEFV